MRGPLSFGKENLSFKLAMEDAGCFELLMLLNGLKFFKTSGSQRSRQALRV